MFAALTALLIVAPAAAQTNTIGNAAADAAIEADAKATALRSEADAADLKARKARFAAIALARRIQDGEARARAIEVRLAGLERTARAQRARLAERQGEVSRLLAALQTLTRRPAALALLEPSSAIATARVSALLDAVQPQLQAQTKRLNSELATTRRLRSRLAAARTQLAAVETLLAKDIERLDALQTEARVARDRLDAEADALREEARRHAREAIDLRGLAVAVERGGNRRPRQASAFIEAGGTGSYRLPASGTALAKFGTRDASGAPVRGLTLATRTNAQVTAPAAGRIAYAGPFRTYRDIVIVEHSADLLTLLSGLERVDVVVGEEVSAGTPIGRMGSPSPELYVELRRAGVPVDPLTAAASAQRVRRSPASVSNR